MARRGFTVTTGGRGSTSPPRICQVAVRRSERRSPAGTMTNAATSKETTHLFSRFLDEHTDVFDVEAGKVTELDTPFSPARRRFMPSDSVS